VDTMEIAIIEQIGVTLIIGLMIGLQREMYYHRKGRSGFAGARTFALIALLGYLSAWMQNFIPFFLHVSLLLLNRENRFSWLYHRNRLFCNLYSGYDDVFFIRELCRTYSSDHVAFT